MPEGFGAFRAYAKAAWHRFLELTGYEYLEAPPEAPQNFPLETSLYSPTELLPGFFDSFSAFPRFNDTPFATSVRPFGSFLRVFRAFALVSFFTRRTARFLFLSATT